MATINYPFKRTQLSAEGSAEVLGRGSNDYTDKYSNASNINTLSNWEKWNDFPTAVRFGNFIYCLTEYGNDRIRYQLIDVVPDPNIDQPYQFGNNIAFPEVEEYAFFDGQYVLGNSDDSNNFDVDSSMDEGSYPILSVTASAYSFSSKMGGTLYNTSYDFENIIGIFESGTWTSARIHEGTNNRHIIHGWGEAATGLGSNGYTFSHYFAPFATKDQFETVYGKESDWVVVNQNLNNDARWMFEAPDGATVTDIAFPNGTSDLQSFSEDGRTNYYPFTVQEMTPNTLYRDVPGDNTGNGEVDKVSFVDAAAGVAVASAISGATDAIAKCGLPSLPDISGALGDLADKLKGLEGLPGKLIAKAKAEVKEKIAAGVDAAGLLEIVEKAEGLKDLLLNAIPKLPDFPNLMIELSKIDLNDIEQLEELKKKWGGVVDNIEEIIEKFKLPEFDICSLIGVNAKKNDDGTLAKIPEPPVIPDKAVDLSLTTQVDPITGEEIPQGVVKFELTRNDYKAAEDKFNQLWEENILNNSAIIGAEKDYKDRLTFISQQEAFNVFTNNDSNAMDILQSEKEAYYNLRWTDNVIEREKVRAYGLVYKSYRENYIDNWEDMDPYQPLINFKVGDLILFGAGSIDYGGKDVYIQQEYYDKVVEYLEFFRQAVKTEMINKEVAEEMKALAAAWPADNTLIQSSSDIELTGAWKYGPPTWDVDTLMDINSAERKPLIDKYWDNRRSFVQRQLDKRKNSSINKSTGSLKASDAYNGAYGRRLVSGYSVSNVQFPGGTILKVTLDGQPYDPAGINPEGRYTVDDTGPVNRVYDKIDIFVDEKIQGKFKTSDLAKVKITVIKLGTQTSPQYNRAQRQRGKDKNKSNTQLNIESTSTKKKIQWDR